MKKKIISIYDKTEIKTGSHKRYVGLLKELEARGYSIAFFSPTDFLKSAIHLNIEVSKKWLPTSLQTLISVRNKYKSVKKNLSSYDFILVFGFSPVFAAIYLKKFLGIPIVYAVRSNIYEYRKLNISTKRAASRLQKGLNIIYTKIYLFIFSRLEHYVYGNTDLIIVQSDNDYESLYRRYDIDKSKIRVVPNNINFNKPANPTYTNKSEKLNSVIFVGSLNKRKGIMLLLEAIRKLVAEEIRIRLDICGEGPLVSKVSDFIYTNNLNDYINYHGYLDEPIKRIAEADLMVVPSLKDAFPNSVLEALYVGTPVIGSNTGGIKEILGDESLLFEPDSVSAIVNKLKMLLEAENYEKCRKNCNKRREKFLFDWTGKFEQLFAEIV